MLIPTTRPDRTNLHHVAGHAFELLGLDGLVVEQVAPLHLENGNRKHHRKHEKHGGHDERGGYGAYTWRTR